MEWGNQSVLKSPTTFWKRLAFSTVNLGQDAENHSQNRVVGQIDDERDFHIFYQFTKGASAEMKGSSSFVSWVAY